MEKNEIAERIEELFYAALNEMTTNQIADLEMVDYLCKPIVKAIESNFYSCSEFYHPFFFSSKIIQDILSLSPSCLQNEDAHISDSFKVLCLRDTACEKLHLKNTLKKLKRAKHDQRKIIAYIAIIMIAFNGENVTLDVDDELKTLRFQVLSACGKMITVSKDGIMLNSKNIKI